MKMHGDGSKIKTPNLMRYLISQTINVCILGGECDVIPGVDAAVKTMKKDEISLVNCDSSYAFGEKGKEEWGIGPSMSVEYEIHLKSFEQVDHMLHELSLKFFNM